MKKLAADLADAKREITKTGKDASQTSGSLGSIVKQIGENEGAVKGGQSQLGQVEKTLQKIRSFNKWHPDFSNIKALK